MSDQKIEVVDWIPYEKASELPEAVGGMGGWFGLDEDWSSWREVRHRWADYIAIWNDDVKPYVEAIRASVLKHELRFRGDEHQHSEHGCPLFSDGKTATFSYRGWGDLMAAIWSEKEDKNYCYMDFYCGGS